MKVTYGDLIAGAASKDPAVRKRAYAVFQTWIKMAPRLSPDRRLNYSEREVLTKIFAQKGFGVEQPARRRAS